MPLWLDGSLYPDMETPSTLDSHEDRVDFLVRLCGAWDFGILPYQETVVEIRKPDWREAVDSAQFVTSSSYHLVRSWHGLPEIPYLGQQFAYIRDDPFLNFV